ncbi:MAG: hypothetical protein BGO90_13785 [Legionella sp. 40-6]|mgnify:CR=1 FL=1|nr:hypothetical protein [Legionella sp.]OJX93207.1 MAG: hypothetical protein BGO90_13785 [Legionella sp. 40-6]
MKKFLFTLLLVLMSSSQASKLSKYFKDMEKEQNARAAYEWQQDMNFPDMSFRLERRYLDEQGQRCRSYIFRSRSNPFRHGYYTVCDER